MKSPTEKHGIQNAPSRAAVARRGLTSLLCAPLASAGVFWDLQRSTLEGVERIEVIRGPVATICSANAVNGVINVVSRSTIDTQGEYLDGGGGTSHRTLGGARYGGKLGAPTYFRVFGSYHLLDPRHAEQSGQVGTLTSEAPRGVHARVQWHF